jgi:hypothetical protein
MGDGYGAPRAAVLPHQDGAGPKLRPEWPRRRKAAANSCRATGRRLPRLNRIVG